MSSVGRLIFAADEDVVIYVETALEHRYSIRCCAPE
jgi:hypothetical protein